MIIADENISADLVSKMRNAGFEVFSIREQSPGLEDGAIADLVKSKHALLVTEDKDFGELVFSHSFDQATIILLRYPKNGRDHVESRLITTLRDYHTREGNFFITINHWRTRVVPL